MKYFVPRKNHRLKSYNYSENGSYFITICIKNKECLFGEIVGGDVHGTPEQLNNINDMVYLKSTGAKMVLSEYGKIAENFIEEGKVKQNDLSVDNYVIMPNHIHLIITINRIESICSLKSCHSKIPQYVSSLKTLITKETGFSMFQRNYYDHIIRNEKEYKKIWDYIDTNPSNWVADRFYMY